MSRRIEIIEAKDAKAFKNKVNAFYARTDIRITKTVYRMNDKFYNAVVEYERNVFK